MNQKVIITRGPSGSGKTTWSKQYVIDHPKFMRISRDDIDFMLSERTYTKKKEKIIIEIRNTLVMKLLSNKFNLVLDETYLAPKRIKELNDVLRSYVNYRKKHLDIEIKDFLDIPIEKCIERDSQRHFHVGEKFIRLYYRKYVKPLLKERGITKWTI